MGISRTSVPHGRLSDMITASEMLRTRGRFMSREAVPRGRVAFLARD